MKRFYFFLLTTLAVGHIAAQSSKLTSLVNPFIGTTNFGTCNPGAIVPQGMMSAVPFNVMGSDLNHFDKDKRWWSTPYENTNSYFTGFSHVNLSGVGCPDLASLLLMPTSGTLNADYMSYGSTYTQEEAHPGYYTNMLTKYGIRTEVTATERSSRARFTFPAGQGNVMLNLGEGLSTENGAYVRYVNEMEVEGTKMLGGFCYNSPRAYYPIYFVARVSKAPAKRGFWKLMRPNNEITQEWNHEGGTYKYYDGYRRDMGGDHIGAYWTYDATEGEQVEVSIGVSFVSIENARLNLESEQYAHGKPYAFEELRHKADKKWEKALSVVEVEGGTDDERTVFYTALYHLNIHPNIMDDVNGEYPVMEGEDVRNIADKGSALQDSDGKRNHRYTVFSLWDTYRCTHQLITILYPRLQQTLVKSMLQVYQEWGWLPKWELYGRETFTMEGDPAIPVIVDTWMKGLRDFDIEQAYTAMRKGADTPQKDNPLRPDNDDYIRLGYCPMTEQYDNSVSHALEYYVADYALSTLAEKLGKKDDAKLFRQRSMGYKHYYSPEFGTLRPILPSGEFYAPFNPKQGENWEPSPGFHEGNAWNYTFAVPHDIPGLCRLMGGKKAFVERLQSVFDQKNYDPANEPDIAYPYFFSYWPDEAWRTQKLTRQLLREYFRNAPDGIPGNEDTGTMSAWAIFSMIGLYPDCPGLPNYTLTAPVFDKVTIHPEPSSADEHPEPIVITTHNATQSDRIKSVRLGGKALKGYRITHDQLMKGRTLDIQMAH